jgi:hypothetical protein
VGHVWTIRDASLDDTNHRRKFYGFLPWSNKIKICLKNMHYKNHVLGIIDGVMDDQCNVI